jgi:hypothetical protein
MNLEKDWIKLAARQASKEDVERMFADQAFTFVSNKAGKLVQPPHLLGFEMVYHNDDKTRLVGVFAAKTDDELLYAPVFFLNGQIKGDSLLYRVKARKFVPLNEEWCNYLLERNKPALGFAQPKSVTDRYRTSTNLTPLIRPQYIKYASAESMKQWRDFIETYMLPDTTKSASFDKEGLLRRYIDEDGGEPAFNAIAGAIKKSHVFAEALMTCLDLCDFAPPAVTKSASAPEEKEGLVLYTGGVKSASTAEHMTKLAKDGFYLYDTRSPEHLTEVYDEDNYVETINGSGCYEAKKMDGDFVKVLTGPIRSLKSAQSINGCPRPISSCDTDRICAVTMDGKHTWTTLSPGTTVGRQVEKFDVGGSKPAVGNMYVIYSTEQGCFYGEPVLVTAIEKNRNGTYTLGLSERYEYSTSPYIYNPDAPTSEPEEGLLGSDVAFIELESTDKGDNYKVRDLSGGEINGRQLTEAPVFMDAKVAAKDLRQVGMRKLRVAFKPEQGYTVSQGTKTARFHEKLAATVYLTQDLGMHAAVAGAVLDKADTGKESGYAVKIASALTSIIDRPDFRPSYDSEFNTRVEYPRGYALRTYTDQPPRSEPVGLNESYDPAMGSKGNTSEGNTTGLEIEDVLTSDPQGLQQLAESKGLPFVFEHGLVGSLVNTFDAIAAIDKYIPEMESGLDRIGRTLFLFYWKPEDFQRAFGQDDQPDMENELLSNFKSFGNMLLKLLKKSKHAREGSPART